MKLDAHAERHLRTMVGRALTEPARAHPVGSVRVSRWPLFRTRFTEDSIGATDHWGGPLLKILRGTAATPAPGLRLPFRSPVREIQFNGPVKAAQADPDRGVIVLGRPITAALADVAAGQALLRAGKTLAPHERELWNAKASLVSQALRHERMHFANRASREYRTADAGVIEGVTELQAQDTATIRRFARKTGLPYLAKEEAAWTTPAYKGYREMMDARTRGPDIPLLGRLIQQHRWARTVD